MIFKVGAGPTKAQLPSDNADAGVTPLNTATALVGMLKVLHVFKQQLC